MSIDASRPSVSVIMANFNGEPHIAAAVRSTLRQTLSSLELIISDDGSTDGSLERARAEAGADPRLRILTHETGRTGPAAARNRAIRAARGRWLAIVDSDDFMHPERLEKLIGAAERDGADIAADDLLVFYEDRTREPHGFLTGARAKSPTWVSAAEYVRLDQILSGKRGLGYLKPVIRSDAAPGYDETLRIAEDYDLIAGLLLAGKRMRLYPELTYFYRKHSRSISHRLTAADMDTIIAAHDRQAAHASSDREVQQALKSRRSLLSTARGFCDLIEALKSRRLVAAAGVVLRQPGALWLLRVPIVDRLARIFRRKAAKPAPTQRRIALLSRQRIVGATNGSSGYVLGLVRALTNAGYAVDFIGASPKVFGRWPLLRLRPETKVFASYGVRGGLRTGPIIWATDLRIALRAAQAVISFALAKLTSVKAQPAPADYAIAARAQRKDLLYVARRSRAGVLAVFCDYAFLAPLAPYALAPNAPKLTIMHDLLSERVSDGTVEHVPQGVSGISADDEFRLLALADVVVAIQAEEEAQVRVRLPRLKTIVVPWTKPCAAEPQVGQDDTILFVGSNTGANAAGLHWFLRECWPEITARRPTAKLLVAGSIGRVAPRPPRGVSVLGVVDDLDALYREAGVVVAPLLTGSGLKIKVVEALAAGKATVGTSISAQGVASLVAGAMVVVDDPKEFADAVLRLADDRSWRLALAGAALECAQAHFSPEAGQSGFLQLLTQELGAAPPQAAPRQRPTVEELGALSTGASTN